MVDAKTALRDVLTGTGTPAKWLRSEEDMDQLAQQQERKMQAQELINTVAQGGQAMESVGKGAQALGLGV